MEYEKNTCVPASNHTCAIKKINKNHLPSKSSSLSMRTAILGKIRVTITSNVNLYHVTTFPRKL